MKENTKQAFSKALTRLLNQYPLDEITINRLSQEAGLNRNTFYYHFHDIYELIRYGLDQAIVELRTRIPADESVQERYHRIYLYILENQKCVYHIYYSVQREYLEQFLQDVVKNILLVNIIEELKEYAISENRISFFIDTITYAYVGLLLDWIKKGMQEDFEDQLEESIQRFETNKETILALLL